MKKLQAKNKLIYLEWEDACSLHEWRHESQLLDWANNTEYMVKQVGWLIKETKRFIFIASRFSPGNTYQEIYEDQYGMLQKIPKTWVRKRINLSKYII